MTIKEQIATFGKIAWEKNADDESFSAINGSLKLLAKLEAAKVPLDAEKIIEKFKTKKTKYSKYQDFVKVYDDFCREHIGVGSKMDGAQGKALNTIIKYLVKESKMKDENGALLAWKFILENWKRLTPFVQNQTTLLQINKNLLEILTQLRNGSTKATIKANKNASIRKRIANKRRQ